MIIFIRTNNKCLNNSVAGVENNSRIDDNRCERYLLKHAYELTDSNRYFWHLSLLVFEFTHYGFHCYHVTYKAY